MVRSSRLALLSLLLAAVVVGGYAAWIVRSARAPDASGDLEVLGRYGRVPPFALVERSGRRVTREDLRGVAWVVDFFYTDCEDTCPTLGLALARLDREVRSGAPFRLVSVSVDPAHDTPAVLKRYADGYHAGDRWWFLTGERDEIFCLARAFGLAVVDDAGGPPADCGRRFSLGPTPAWAHGGAGGRTITHSARVALVDAAGEIRSYHDGTDPASLGRLRANLARLLGAAAVRAAR